MKMSVAPLRERKSRTARGAACKETVMIDNDQQQQLHIARYMTAVAQLLGGRTVDCDAFRNRVDLIVGGSAVGLSTLMHWGGHVRRTGRPILQFSPSDEPSVPNVSLVGKAAGRTHIIENCMLWLGENDERARLVPDNFSMGCFALGADLRLQHLRRAPAPDFDAALVGMQRAYGRLLELEMELAASGYEPALPSLLPKAA